MSSIMILICLKNFLRFSKDNLSNSKSDRKFNPSLESCLLSVPGSLNGKFLENRGKRLSGNFQVKILQKWNGERAIISDEFLEDFRIYLIYKKINGIKENKKNNTSSYNYTNDNNFHYYEWIDRLLQIPIKNIEKELYGKFYVLIL